MYEALLGLQVYEALRYLRERRLISAEMAASKMPLSGAHVSRTLPSSFITLLTSLRSQNCFRCGS